MAFRLKRKEKTGEGLRRLLDRDLGAALADLAGGDRPLDDRIHAVRRRLKRDRSLLRVLTALAPAQAGRIRLLLRDAGRALAHLREPQVLAATAAGLGLAVEPPAAVPPPAEPLQAAADLIDAARRSAADLPSRGARRSFRAMLRRAARRAAGAFATAHVTRDTHDLHEWRKRLKDVVHLVRVGGGQIDGGRKLFAAASEAEELLGEDHDLAEVGTRVVAFARDPGRRAAGTAKIGHRRAALQRRAFRLGSAMACLPAPRLR